MKVYGTICLMVTLLVCSTALCENKREEMMPAAEEVAQQMRVRAMQHEMEAEDAELRFNQEMRRLELEKRKIEIENMRKGPMKAGMKEHHDDGGKVVFLLAFITIHILLTIWVYRDIKERGKGSGIWVAVVLLAGILGVIPYAIVRLGDMRETKA